MISTIMLCLIHTYLQHNGPNSFLKEHSFLYFKIIHDPRISYQVRDVGILGVGNAMTSTHVGRSVNPISAVHSAEEAHYQSYAQQITTCPPEFPDLPSALQLMVIRIGNSEYICKKQQGLKSIFNTNLIIILFYFYSTQGSYYISTYLYKM